MNSNNNYVNNEVPMSMIVKFGKLKLRCLLDTGSAKSIISSRIFDTLKPKPDLKSRYVPLQSASGHSLKVLGTADIRIKINNLYIVQNFIVVDNLNRNCILCFNKFL